MDIPTKGSAYQEIRLNENYAHLYVSEFDDSKAKEDGIPIIKRKTLRTETYMKKVLLQTAGNSILPANCRYIEETEGGGHVVIIEEPPAMRTIKINMNLNHEIEILKNKGKLELYGYKGYNPSQKHTFSLAFPYVIFMLYITKNFELSFGQVFLRPARMLGLSDYICKAPLLNIGSNQYICFGSHGHTNASKSLNEAVEHSIMVFWSAEFNPDYSINYTIYENTPILSTYLEWNYMSAENPMFVYDAEWIKMPHLLGEQITQFKAKANIRNKRDMTFYQLSESFYTPVNSGKELKGSRSARKHTLYYDICQGIWVDDINYLNVGDTITMKNGDIAYVDSFAGFENGGQIKFIIFECNGRTFHIKVNQKSLKFLSDQIKKERFAETATLKNNVVVKPGDIIMIVNRGAKKIYQKVKYIRKSRGENGDSKELKLTSDFYFANNLEADIFDMKNPIIYGVPLTEKENYLLPTDSNRMGSQTPVYFTKFDSLDISGHHIVAKFKSATAQHAVILDQPYTFQPLYVEKDCKPLPQVVRMGRKILNIVATTTRKLKDDDIRAWTFGGRIFINEQFKTNSVSISQVIDLIKDNVFSIAGVDFDTSFEVGDRVVCADWENPLEVLNVKTITGFKHDSNNNSISFVLSDKNGKVSSVKYVDGITNIIYTGKIRKVTNKYKKLSVGTKIIAKKAGIPAFPKKDTNIVVAIIMDSPYEPLVLCSNGCTLWYSTVMNDFERITIRAKKWKTLNHAPLDLSKIKFQAGDIVNGRSGYKTNGGYLLFNPTGNKTPRAVQCIYYNQSEDMYSYTIDKHMLNDIILDCIPNPRVGSKTKYKAGFYDFHGRLIDDFNKSFYSFINDRRGEINVPNTHK